MRLAFSCFFAPTEEWEGEEILGPRAGLKF